MKKTIIISAIALGFAFSTSYATSVLPTAQSISLVKKKVLVNPFCMSIVKGDHETVEKLIQLGADVNEWSNGMTPSMYAARYNKVDILKLLVQNGADLHKKTEKGWTAKDFAKRSNAVDALAYLESLSK